MSLDRRKSKALADSGQLRGTDNPYLADEKRGLQLVASLLAEGTRPEGGKIWSTLDRMIGACGRLDVDSEAFPKLRQALNLLQNPARNRLLRDKVIVGFGGQFSSGKSSVLNSLLDTKAHFELPVDTAACTSIATYVMHAPTDKVMACASNGRETPLDAEALKAISHGFRNMHKINLAQFIDFIGISLPHFPVEGIALLDTPGYSASDTSAAQEYRDRSRSERALRSIDHLVWIIGVDAGTLDQTDIEFIKYLNITGEIAAVVNKCDIKPESECNDIIAKIADESKERGIRFSEIIRYSAKEPDLYSGKTRFHDFLKRVSRGKKNAQQRESDIKDILSEIAKGFQSKLTQSFKDEMAEIDKCLDASTNPLALGSLVRLRGMLGHEHSNLEHDSKVFEELKESLLGWVEQQGRK